MDLVDVYQFQVVGILIQLANLHQNKKINIPLKVIQGHPVLLGDSQASVWVIENLVFCFSCCTKFLEISQIQVDKLITHLQVFIFIEYIFLSMETV